MRWLRVRWRWLQRLHVMRKRQQSGSHARRLGTMRRAQRRLRVGRRSAITTQHASGCAASRQRIGSMWCGVLAGAVNTGGRLRGGTAFRWVSAWHGATGLRRLSGTRRREASSAPHGHGGASAQWTRATVVGTQHGRSAASVHDGDIRGTAVGSTLGQFAAL